MQYASFCMSIRSCQTLLILLAFMTSLSSQTHDSLLINNLNEDRGIWSGGQFSYLVEVTPDNDDKWILLQKGEGNISPDSPHDDPFLASGKISLKDFCGANLAFDITTFNICLLYTSPSPRDLSTSRMPSSA